jgi:hypothetical protein
MPVPMVRARFSANAARRLVAGDWFRGGELGGVFVSPSLPFHRIVVFSVIRENGDPGHALQNQQVSFRQLFIMQ